MFNPNSPIDSAYIWDLLGSFYKLLDSDSKGVMETTWDAMANGTEALFYNLAQASLATYIGEGPGYLERGYEYYNFIFEGTLANYSQLDRYDAPTVSGYAQTPSGDDVLYSYAVTSVYDGEETTPSLTVPIISGASDLGATPNIIEWAAISGITDYKVYGRTAASLTYLATVTGVTTYTDTGVAAGAGVPPVVNTTVKSYVFDLPEPWTWMTIPTLSGLETNQVLVENTDYEIVNLHKIKFNNNFTTTAEVGKIEIETPRTDEKSVKVLNKTSICLLPSLTSIYIPAFGEAGADPETIIYQGLYAPYISGYNSMTYFDQRKTYATHLAKWAHATTYKLRQAPSMPRINDAVSLFNNLPFSYFTGSITSIVASGGDNYVTVTTSGTTDTVCYQIPNTLYLKYGVSDAVSQYDILCSGVTIIDYKNDPVTISGMLDKEGETLVFDVYTHNRGGSKPEYFITKTLSKDLVVGVEQMDIVRNADGGKNG